VINAVTDNVIIAIERSRKKIHQLKSGKVKINVGSNQKITNSDVV